MKRKYKVYAVLDGKVSKFYHELRSYKKARKIARALIKPFVHF